MANMTQEVELSEGSDSSRLWLRLRPGLRTNETTASMWDESDRTVGSGDDGVDLRWRADTDPRAHSHAQCEQLLSTFREHGGAEAHGVVAQRLSESSPHDGKRVAWARDFTVDHGLILVLT